VVKVMAICQSRAGVLTLLGVSSVGQGQGQGQGLLLMAYNDAGVAAFASFDVAAVSASPPLTDAALHSVTRSLEVPQPGRVGLQMQVERMEVCLPWVDVKVGDVTVERVSLFSP
jgi:hypothetical protein